MMTISEFWLRSGGRSLMNVIMDVHITANGSSLRSMEDQQKDIDLLMDKLAFGWQEPWSLQAEEVDHCIKELVRAVLREAAVAMETEQAKDGEGHP